MKKHDYLKLKIGVIEQYSMIIKKKDMPHWRNLGWLEFSEIWLPEWDEEADMLYGEMKKSETLVFNRPTMVKDIAKQEIIGHKIIEVSTHLGTYGMGGPWFFGLLLDNEEFLTYAVWSAGNYVIINDRVVECHPKLYNKTKPWLSNFGNGQTWDDLTNYICGSIIVNYVFTQDNFTLTLQKGKETIEVTFVKNDHRIPRKVWRKRNAYKKWVIADYILLQHQDWTLIV